MFIGYPPWQKGYKLYNLVTHEVFHSRDVLFTADVFPFKDHNTQSIPHTTPTFQNPMFSPKSDDPIDDTLANL